MGFGLGAAGDLRLTTAGVPAVDAGVALAPGLADTDHDAQPRDATPDVGADEASGIFTDGFEAGHLAAWSAASP